MRNRILLMILGIGLIGGAYGGYEYLLGRKCNPNGRCNACSNCKYCKHCAKNGGKCSVCR